MTEKDKTGEGDQQSVRLNEAFERLEKQHDENLAAGSRGSRGVEAADDETAPGASASGVLGVLLSLIAIGIASYAAWTVYLQTHGSATKPDLAPRVASLDRRVDGYQSQLRQLSERVNALSKQAATNSDVASKQDLDALKQQVNESIAQLRTSLGATGNDWLYAEVEYLLRLANQRVIMEGNVKGALTLFRDADNILQQNEGITAFDLRKAIANNIAQLEAVKQVDIDGIYVRLEALVNQVDTLRQREHEFTPAAPAPVASLPPGSSFSEKLLHLLKRAGARLATLVDFRRNSHPVEPILPPKEEYYLRQNLILKIQMAELALLRGDEAVYANSLKEAQSWLNAHFDRQDTATRAMSNALVRLAGIDIARKMPDVSSSLKEVRKLMAGFQQQPARTGQGK